MDAWSKTLATMQADCRVMPEIYRPSKFWERLNALNESWLDAEGVAHFKRTVNNNYFNWAVSLRSDYFQRVLRYSLRTLLSNPASTAQALLTDFRAISLKTYVDEHVTLSGANLALYRLYVLGLAVFVEKQDTLGLFSSIEEPTYGDPITVKFKGRNISQDICNSYLEYLFVSKTLQWKPNQRRLTIIELGAGYGRFVHMLFMLGQRGQGRPKLIVVDIPPALAISQWYLSLTCSDAVLFEYRDFSRFETVQTEFEAADICFLLPHQLELLPDKTADVFVNISSLQEMSFKQINRYYELIDRLALAFYTKQWLFWTNPEDQQVVPAVMYPTRPHWTLLAGRRHPIHNEFFEAVFRL